MTSRFAALFTVLCMGSSTVDLRSIMSSPLDPLGELTTHDAALLGPFLP